jgi:hypothetical protein
VAESVAQTRGGRPGRLPFYQFVLASLWLFAFVGTALFLIDRQTRPLHYAFLMAGASAPWFWLAFLLFKRERWVPWQWVVVSALLLRALALLGQPALLSDDIYRYVWEGRVQMHADANKRNPFLNPPEDFSEDEPRDPIWEQVNHKEVPAAYPPVCQLYLRTLASMDLGVLGFRNGFALFDLLLVLLIPHWLSRLKKAPGISLIYSLCPLVLIELTVEGHNDALGLFFMVAMFWLLGKSKKLSTTQILLGGVLYGLAIGSKFLPLVLVPWLMRKDWRLLIPAAFTVILSYVPYLPSPDQWPDLMQGLGKFGEKWAHNETIFALIKNVAIFAQTEMEAGGITGWLVDGNNTDAISRLLLFAIYGSGLLFLFWLERDSASAMVPVLGLLYALSPVVHPWYLVWVVPFLCINPSPALFALLAGAQFSYIALLRWQGGVDWVPAHFWEAEWFWKTIEYGPFYALTLWGWLKKSVRRGQEC